MLYEKTWRRKVTSQRRLLREFLRQAVRIASKCDVPLTWLNQCVLEMSRREGSLTLGEVSPFRRLEERMIEAVIESESHEFRLDDADIKLQVFRSKDGIGARVRDTSSLGGNAEIVKALNSALVELGLFE